MSDKPDHKKIAGWVWFILLVVGGWYMSNANRRSIENCVDKGISRTDCQNYYNP